MKRITVRIYKNKYASVDIQHMGHKYNVLLDNKLHGQQLEVPSDQTFGVFYNGDPNVLVPTEFFPGFLAVDKKKTKARVSFGDNDELIDLMPIKSSNPNDPTHTGYAAVDQLFEGMYTGWRETRINKLVNLLGKEWFKNKTILELGSGHAHIGNALSQLGAKMTCTDGRLEHVEFIKQNYPHIETFQLDQDKPWNLNRQFDLVINWGVSYHLDNWQSDLLTSILHGRMVSLETNCADSSKDDYQAKVPEEGFDQAVNKVGSRPSAAFVERVIESAGATYIRYDDADLNWKFHTYDWPLTDSGNWFHGARRFWIIQS